MRRLLAVMAMAMVVLSLFPTVFATSTGVNTGVDITTEDFPPMVWMCGNRIVTDDNVQGWRNGEGSELLERINNYAFEGESIQWEVLVMDKNGAQKVSEVFATIGDTQGAGNDIEANCVEDLGFSVIVEPSCNARILEEDLSNTPLDDATQRYYTCTLTVESPDSMYGEYWITVEAVDLDGLSGTIDENEYWFLNPIISLNLDGDLTFEDVRPGAVSYSDTLLITNDADDGSGVMLDMFISGTDFFDTSSSGAACPDSNVLRLNDVGPDGALSTSADNDAIIDDTGIRYYAVNGAYSTVTDETDDDNDYDPNTDRYRDNEGYVNIQYGNSFEVAMYTEAEILQAGDPIMAGLPIDSYRANLLAPGADMALTFKLILPEPCNGDFDSGNIYFWGEAI